MKNVLCVVSLTVGMACGSVGGDAPAPLTDATASVDQGSQADNSGSSGHSLPLKFVLDPGIRIDKATNAWASVLEDSDGSQKVYLWYLDRSVSATGPGEQYVIVSEDGLEFDRDTAHEYKKPNYAGAPEDVIRNDPRHKLMPADENGGPIWRIYAGTPDGVKTQSSTDGLNFVLDDGYAYLYHNEGEGLENDKGSIGYNDVHPTPDGRLVFTYIGDMGPEGYNNVRMAISTDNGKSFQWEKANVLDDAHLVEEGGHQACSYVDPKPTVLPDGGIWYFLMTQACEPPAPVIGRATGYIHSFYSPDGVNFTKDEGIRLQPSDFDWETFGFVVYSLNDPTVVRLVDGRYRMFVTARICDSQEPQDCDAGGPGNIREALVSATATPE
jgi:hypothetical protein